MNKKELKQKLILTKAIDNNEYLDKYIDLIFNNLNTKKEKFKTLRHHIIPRCYFKYYNLDVDNSPENLINLLYKDHILAHCYLELCSKPISWFLGNNYYAIYKLSGNIKLSKELLIQLVNDNIPEFFDKVKVRGVLSEEHKKNLSLACKGKSGTNTGKKMLYDLNGIRRYVNVKDFEYYLSIGYTLPLNKKKQLIINNTKLKHTYNSHMSKEEKHLHLSDAHIGLPANNKGKPCSEEQKLKISASIKGSKWMNNGKNQLQVKKNEINLYLNLGYKFGRLKNIVKEVKQNEQIN